MVGEHRTSKGRLVIRDRLALVILQPETVTITRFFCASFFFAADSRCKALGFGVDGMGWKFDGQDMKLKDKKSLLAG